MVDVFLSQSTQCKIDNITRQKDDVNSFPSISNGFPGK